MERPKLTAIITGAISVILAIVYLILVQLLDSRGVMIPAPIDDFSSLHGLTTALAATVTANLMIANVLTWII